MLADLYETTTAEHLGRTAASLVEVKPSRARGGLCSAVSDLHAAARVSPREKLPCQSASRTLDDLAQKCLSLRCRFRWSGSVHHSPRTIDAIAGGEPGPKLDEPPQIAFSRLPLDERAQQIGASHSRTVAVG